MAKLRLFRSRTLVTALCVGLLSVLLISRLQAAIEVYRGDEEKRAAEDLKLEKIAHAPPVDEATLLEPDLGKVEENYEKDLSDISTSMIEDNAKALKDDARELADGVGDIKKAGEELFKNLDETLAVVQGEIEALSGEIEGALKQAQALATEAQAAVEQAQAEVEAAVGAAKAEAEKALAQAQKEAEAAVAEAAKETELALKSAGESVSKDLEGALAEMARYGGNELGLVEGKDGAVTEANKPGSTAKYALASQNKLNELKYTLAARNETGPAFKRYCAKTGECGNQVSALDWLLPVAVAAVNQREFNAFWEGERDEAAALLDKAEQTQRRHEREMVAYDRTSHQSTMLDLEMAKLQEINANEQVITEAVLQFEIKNDQGGGSHTGDGSLSFKATPSSLWGWTFLPQALLNFTTT